MGLLSVGFPRACVYRVYVLKARQACVEKRSSKFTREGVETIYRNFHHRFRQYRGVFRERERERDCNKYCATVPAKRIDCTPCSNSVCIRSPCSSSSLSTRKESSSTKEWRTRRELMRASVRMRKMPARARARLPRCNFTLSSYHSPSSNARTQSAEI